MEPGEMEPGQVVSVEVEVVAWDPRNSTAMEQRRLDVPAGLEPQDVRAWVEQRYGPPSGAAYSSGAGFDGLPVAWSYPLRLMPEWADLHAGATLLVIPYVCFSNGSRRELLLHQADEEQRFAQLIATLDHELGRVRHAGTAPPVDHAAADSGGPLMDPPREQRRRMADEHFELYHSDRAGIALEVTGWLRRLLSEGNTYLVVTIRDDSRYVQFVTHDGAWLRAEAVGPRYVPDRPLSEQELDALREAGWHEPTPDSGNFWREWDDERGGIDVVEAAELAAATMYAFGLLDGADASVHTGRSPTPFS